MAQIPLSSVTSIVLAVSPQLNLFIATLYISTATYYLIISVYVSPDITLSQTFMPPLSSDFHKSNA